MNEIFKVDLPLRDLFECSTVAALANRIEGKDLEATQDHRRNAGSEALITLHREPGDKRIFCFPYRGGFRNEYFNFSRISRYLAGLGYSFYGLGSRGVDGIGEPRRSVKEIGADYLEAIQRLQPHGPYYLIGECGGGILAHAVAERLQCLGEKVALLILFDTQAWSLGASIWWRLTERKRSRHILGFERDLYRTPRIWGYFGARMKLHLKELRRLKRYSQRFRYFLDKAANTVTAVPYFLQRDTSVHHQGVNLRIDNNTAQDLKRAEKTYFLAAHRYRYHRYKGRIALLVNEEWHASDPTLGWDKFAAGGLDVYKIPGNHDTCIPDNIPLVAELLRERLAKADAASKQWI